MDCPFCNIKKEKTKVVNEGKYTRVVLSNPRLVPGHLLVVPKRHVEKISELNKEERNELFDKTIESQEKVLFKFANGCDIRQNYRPFQKQDDVKVNHLHIHIQPRELKDELYKKCQIFEKQLLFKPLSEEEKEKFYKLLK